MAALYDAVNTDFVLQELAQTPLILNIMSLASQGTGGDKLVGQKGDSREGRRKQIFRLYVQQMFKRKETNSILFPEEKTIARLSWLAGKMEEHSQSVFLIKGLQPSWLSTRAERIEYGTAVALSLGLLFALTVGPTFGLTFGLNVGPTSELTSGLTLGPTSGLTVALTVGLAILVGVGLGCWSEFSLMNGIISGSIGGLIVGLIYGLIGGLIVGLIGVLGVDSLNDITLVETISWKWNQVRKRAISGSIVGLIVGLIPGLIVLMIVWLIGALIGLIAGMNVELIVGLIGALNLWLIGGLGVGLIFGLIFGLIVGLNRGGSAVIKHYALRLILWVNGQPFNYIKFLDHCAKVVLLKKVGDGYIFIHRMLLEYFADMAPQSTKAADAVKNGG